MSLQLKVKQSGNDFSSQHFFQKTNFTTMKPQVDLFLFVFFKEIGDIKKTFQNKMTFSTSPSYSFTTKDHFVYYIIVKPNF